MAAPSQARNRLGASGAENPMEKTCQSRWLEGSKVIGSGVVIGSIAEIIRRFWAEILAFGITTALGALHIIHP